jgi:acetyl esterase/lipase
MLTSSAPPSQLSYLCTVLSRRSDIKLEEPLHWEAGHRGLPKTYFQIARADLSIDDALLYEEILGGEGVATRVDLFPASQDCPMRSNVSFQTRNSCDGLEGDDESRVEVVGCGWGKLSRQC